MICHTIWEVLVTKTRLKVKSDVEGSPVAHSWIKTWLKSELSVAKFKTDSKPQNSTTYSIN